VICPASFFKLGFVCRLSRPFACFRRRRTPARFLVPLECPMAVLTERAPSRPAAATAPVAEFTGVSKTYGGGWLRSRAVQAVRNVSFQIRAGEVFALLGPNRAGKTTLVKILLSLCRATEGQVRRLGQPVSDRSTLARVGYMHEKHAFPPYLTAA